LTLGVAEAARRLGLGIDVRLAVDVDADAVAVYGANLPGADVRCGQVEELFDGDCGSRLTSAEGRIRKQVGPVDVLVGGPPCQGHSDLNNHTRRADPRNALYAKMARAAEVLRPSLVLVENVPTVTHDVEKVVEATVRGLAAAGYAVAEAIVDVLRLGAPQRRRRHVVLASRDPRVDVGNLASSPGQRCPRHPARSVRWAIGDLVKVRSDGLFDSASTPNMDNVDRIAWLFEHRKYDLPNHLRPECHQSDHSYNSMYGRLRWDEPAQTVTTGFGSMGQGRYVHPARRRTLTPHEAARLQMLPDFWDFGAVEKRGSMATLVGNAVPPVLASALLEPALRSLGLEPKVAFPAPGDGRPAQKRSTGAVTRSRPGAPTRRAGVPAPSSAEAQRRMQATRRHDTAAELALRAEIDALGLPYEADASLPGTRRRADLLFEGSGVVVLVDGCFWHACPTHGTSPKANSVWWQQKLEANRRRDQDTDRKLHESGWVVLRFWEHDDPSQSARSVAAVTAARAAERVAMESATGGLSGWG
jgi:DNA (cytosine-5)-methyltransferase 1